MVEVAILVATYNGENYLTDLIDSIMKQTFQNFICYVHDDGSTDKTMEILIQLRNKYADKIIILDYPPTGSAKANFMSMLAYPSEPYIMFADQDDYWLEDKIEKSLNEIKKIESDTRVPSLVFTDLEVVDSNLSILDRSFMNKMGFDPKRIRYQQLMAENIGAGCTMIMNNTLLKIVSRLNNLDNIRMHDGWFMVVAAIYGKIKYIPESTILYRQHSTNVCGSKKESIKSKIYKNIKLFINDENRKAKQKWLFQMDNMATELLTFDDLPDTINKTLNELILIHKKNKFQRITFYVRNHFLRNKRNLWMLMWV